MMPKRFVTSESVREELRCVLGPDLKYPASVLSSVERERAQDFEVHVAHWNDENTPVSGSNLWIVPLVSLTADFTVSLTRLVVGLTTRLKEIPMAFAYLAGIDS